MTFITTYYQQKTTLSNAYFCVIVHLPASTFIFLGSLTLRLEDKAEQKEQWLTKIWATQDNQQKDLPVLEVPQSNHHPI